MSGVSKLPKTTDYTKHFDAEWYLDTYYTTCEDGDFLDFILKSYHNIFRTADHAAGILRIDSNSKVSTVILKYHTEHCGQPHGIAIVGNDLIYFDVTKRKLYRTKEYEEATSENQLDIAVFAGTGAEGNEDGLSHECQFSQPSGVCSEGGLRGKTLLDIGTGPSIHSVISASSYFDQIYLSDFLECNRNILTDWKHGKRQNGLELCEHVIQLETNSVKQTKEERLERIRRKVQNILPVDVTNSSPLGDQNIPLPDTVSACLCLEAACATIEEYNKSVNNIGTLLNSGGNLIVVGVVNQSFYRVGDYKFLCLSINKQDIEKAYTDNGFDIRLWQDYFPSEKLETDPDFSDFNTAFSLHAVKR